MFFCGSDILSLPKWTAYFLKRHQTYCENIVEQRKLQECGIYASIHPMLFDDPEKYQVTYEHSSEPTVWATYHPQRAKEYGMDRFFELEKRVPGVRFVAFDGTLSAEDFDSETAKCQAAIRFNEFDGFSENLAKAMLRGQYAFSVIPYPDIETITDDQTLTEQLKELKNKHQPHDTSYWREMLSKRVEV